MQENQTKLSVGHGGAALKHVTFEAGAKKMSEKLKNGSAESFFANAADPLHAAFEAKAVIHSGPGGMPLMGKEARDYLEAVAEQPRNGKTLAYLHVPFCETRCLYCMFYQNAYTDELADRYTDLLIKEMQIWADRPVQKEGDICALYLGGGTPSALSAANLSRILKAAQKAAAEKKAAAPAEENGVDFTHEEEIDFDTFCKVELRVAEVRACENLKESKKLLHLTVFDGERERCILSGIAKWFKPEDLIGKKIGIVCNLAPRPMLKGKYVSEGMIFAADTADGGCSIAFYGDNTPVGSRIH